MANEYAYTKEDYIKFTAELLHLLPVGVVVTYIAQQSKLCRMCRK